ncbi:MAG TPA: hypothetical protein RMH99_04735 [Sandaracinaceae bacterium LLY-WYZ-13_1]|nr:hypothetical protein [Sandaracinaceae bacterium LLY-WYZ-13_1]
MTAARVVFPALDRRVQELPDETSAEALRTFFATRLQDAEVDTASRDGDGRELAELVRAAIRLAMTERLFARCDRAEAVLSNTLSFLTWLVVECPELSAPRRLGGLQAARWCAEELASLYEDHGRPAHARVVRAALGAIERRAFVARAAAPAARSTVS